jgi:Domain of unknown function (DUF397)
MENWRTASYSGADGGQCVEVGSSDGVLVRDTTDRDGGRLGFTAKAWAEFLGTLR